MLSERLKKVVVAGIFACSAAAINAAPMYAAGNGNGLDERPPQMQDSQRPGDNNRKPSQSQENKKKPPVKDNKQNSKKPKVEKEKKAPNSKNNQSPRPSANGQGQYGNNGPQWQGSQQQRPAF